MITMKTFKKHSEAARAHSEYHMRIARRLCLTCGAADALIEGQGIRIKALKNSIGYAMGYLRDAMHSLNAGSIAHSDIIAALNQLSIGLRDGA